MILLPELYLGIKTAGQPFGYVTEGVLGLQQGGGGSGPTIPANGVSSNGSGANFYERIRASSSNPTTYPTLTIRAWVKRTGDRNIWSGWGAANRALEEIMFCGTGVGGTDYYGYCGNNDYESGVNMDTDWHHVCYTYDGTTLIIYQDGVSIGSAALTPSAFGIESISFLNTAFGSWFDGAIQAPAIWERTLSPAEVAADTAQLTPVLTTDLWAWWLLSDVDDVTDRSGQGRDLTRNGTPVAVPGPGIPL